MVLLVGGVARGEPITLRMATVAPEGTAWAREIAAFKRDVEANTNGAVHIKVYYSSIAGDEFTVLDRIKRDQLDGSIGSESCLALSPSMRVTRVVGMFQSREESAYVLTRLKPVIDAEFAKQGFVNVMEVTLGPEILFTREPITTLEDLKKTKLWIWSLDNALSRQTPAMGLHVVPRPLEDAGRAYDNGEVDGFIGIPTAGLAFQWSARAHYLEDLRISYRSACTFFATRAFDTLSADERSVIVAAAGKMRARADDLGKREDDELIGGLFARQGVKAVPVSERFRSEFFDLAQDTRHKPEAKIVDDKLMATVQSWLADYRVMHAVR